VGGELRRAGIVTAPLRWTLAEVAAAVGGDAHGPADLPVTSVTTDSRAVSSGALFVAIAGERFDGHDFAEAAVAAGAAAVLTADDRGIDALPRVVVPDTLTALRDLGTHRRAELTIPVVAVTGSSGKTSTKDLLGHVLPGAWVSPASYNNEIGVPLTVLATPQDAAFLVAEVGSRGKGHISRLMPAVRPDVAIITNLGVVHMETFGSPEALADAKWELIEALGPGGTAVLPRDERRLQRAHAGTTVTFGSGEAADVWFDDVVLDASARPEFTLVCRSGTRRVRMGMAGRHQPWNAAAAAAAALALDVSLDSIAAGLERAEGSPGRMEIHHGTVSVVNDAYNANPDSMEAALRSVAAMPGRHVAVLGLMAELGRMAREEHLRIGRLALDLGYAEVLVVGEEPGLAEAAGRVARQVPDAEQALEVLRSSLRDGDVVLVKASHAVGLEPLALRLVEEVTA
jgi:UDP-N-acetylmuramoyl-tripeptide--D-alanyl-D-alanine ligase